MNNFISFEAYKICDSHLHLADCSLNNAGIIDSCNYYCITCAHSISEYENQEQIKKSNESNIYSSFGIHPQNPDLENSDFLVKLLKDKCIDAVGETGFDFFTEEFRQKSKLQEEAFNIQLDLCAEYNKPMIIHGRKSVEKFFQYSKKLSKLKSVIFHSFMGTYLEAESLLSHGINGYFSFGKQLLNGNKKAVECVRNLDEKHILLETDAPFQTLKNETITEPEDIIKVYSRAMEIRNIDKEKTDDVISFTHQLHSNFLRSLDNF